jgi:hypothetical protein
LSVILSRTSLPIWILALEISYFETFITNWINFLRAYTINKKIKEKIIYIRKN